MLLQDVRQFLKGVLDAEKVLYRIKVAQMHMDDLCSEESGGAVNPIKFVKELKSWQTTLQHFIVKMESEYPLYRDLLSQFLAGISQVEFCIDRKYSMPVNFIFVGYYMIFTYLYQGKGIQHGFSNCRNKFVLFLL